MRILSEYFERKEQEIALLDRCLSKPLDPIPPKSVSEAIELKFRLAALLKADQLIKRWSITETSRNSAGWGNAGPFAFNFGYQRADLQVRGPPIYPMLDSSDSSASTVYTGSGMSAIAALVVASLQLSDRIDVVSAADCYVETRELLASFGPRIRIVPLSTHLNRGANRTPAARVLWLDSSVRCSFLSSIEAITRAVDLVVFDTTCFWRESGKIARAVQRAARMDVPIVLVRSHAKLDTLGIEYGRLGSTVIVMPKVVNGARSRWTTALVPKICDAVRLFGAAPVLANFPPFESIAEYRERSMARTASIIRNSRRLARALESRLPSAGVKTFQHGLYLVIPVGRNASRDEIRRAADEMAADVAGSGLPIKHAGSFGFDFVGVEWCTDPIGRTNSLRISGGDLPLEVTDEIGHGIADWLLHHGVGRARRSMPPAGITPPRSGATFVGVRDER